MWYYYISSHIFLYVFHVVVHFSALLWCCWSSPGNCRLWCRPHTCPACHSRPPSWQSQQPSCGRRHAGCRARRCLPGTSPSHLQGSRHKTCSESDWAHLSWSSLQKQLKRCTCHNPPQGAAHISTYLWVYVLCATLWGRSPTPTWKQIKQRVMPNLFQESGWFVPPKSSTSFFTPSCQWHM